jgi:hypothetical protein
MVIIMRLFAVLLALSAVVFATPKYDGVSPDIDINEELLPDFLDILEEAGMKGRLADLVRMGIVDTRVLLRLKRMDFQMMQFEWQDMTGEMVDTFMEVCGKYAVQATANAQQVEEVMTDYSERDMQRFGRLVLPHGVQSYEYIQASFGGRPPVGLREIIFAENMDACPDDEEGKESAALPRSEKFKDKMLVAKRGNCSFLRKAEFALANGATGLIIVNSVDNLESPSSGVGVDHTVTDKRVMAMKELSVVAVSNTTWSPLKHALDVAADHKLPLFAQTIPLKCGARGYCEAVLEEEMGVTLDISAGQIRVTTSNGESKAFDFLTSTFGSHLLTSGMELIMADPPHGCSPPSLPGGLKDFALVTLRGKCRFDVKALTAEGAGARVVVVVDVDDNALQRLGAAPGIGDAIGIPAVIVTAAAGRYMDAAFMAGDVTGTLEPSSDRAISEAWIDLAFTEFYEATEDALSQLEGLAMKYENSASLEIVSWLKQKSMKVRGMKVKAIETDAM